MLFGVLSAEAGLGPWETQIFSVAVFAGANQLAALQLMQDQAPVLVILATGLAVNLRMMMYSVALTPHLGAAPLGSRLIDRQSQKMTVAARATAERKVFAHRS